MQVSGAEHQYPTLHLVLHLGRHHPAPSERWPSGQGPQATSPAPKEASASASRSRKHFSTPGKHSLVSGQVTRVRSGKRGYDDSMSRCCALAYFPI